MKNEETGEFELVLGNRQLLSGFFIIVLLFGVAFAMGYIVGRNSTPSARLQAEAAGGSGAASKESRPQPASAAAEPASSASSDEPAPQTPAADATPAAEQPAAEPAAQPPVQPARDIPAAATTESTPSGAPEAAPGSYWQVLASVRTSAEAVQQSLKDKGFQVTLAPGPNNLVRVLVGPYSDTPSMGKAKTQLENLGFHPIRK